MTPSPATLRFYDALAANAEKRSPIAPAGTPADKRAPRANVLQRLWHALDRWFYRQRMKEIEAYLARASDRVDLERRVRQIELRQYY